MHAVEGVGDAVTEVEQMLKDCEARESRLTDFERGFIDSAQKRVDDGKGLTPTQVQTLEEIWEKATVKG